MENVKLNFAHICDHASFGEGGKLNILGIFKNIKVKEFPIIHPRMFIVVNILVCIAGKYEETIKLIREEDGVEIMTPLKFNLETKKDNSNIGVVGEINILKFDKSGIYKFKIYVGTDLLEEVSLMVDKI